MAQPFSAIATADRLYQGQPGTTVGTLYTAPAYASGSPYQAGATALAKRLIATNITGSYKGTLTAALTSGTAYTTLDVTALSAPVLSGDSIVLTSGANTQTYTASAYAAPGATSISVNCLSANFSYPIGTTVADITSTPATLTLYLVPSGGTAEGATMICNQMQVAGGDPTIIDLEQSLSPGDTIQGFQGTEDALTVTLSGATFQ